MANRRCELCGDETDWQTPRRYRCLSCGKLVCYRCALCGGTCKKCDRERVEADRRRHGRCLCGCGKPARRLSPYCSTQCKNRHEAT